MTTWPGDLVAWWRGPPVSGCSVSDVAGGEVDDGEARGPSWQRLSLAAPPHEQPGRIQVLLSIPGIARTRSEIVLSERVPRRIGPLLDLLAATVDEPD